MKKRFLLATLIILIMVFLVTGCQEITQEDVDRELNRWWVIYYKMLEAETHMGEIRPGEDSDGKSSSELIQSCVEETLVKEFGLKGTGEHFWEYFINGNLKEKYRFMKRRNQLMEEVLVKLKGEEALKEIEGVWSLDEVPDLWEKVNKQVDS